MLHEGARLVDFLAAVLSIKMRDCNLQFEVPPFLGCRKLATKWRNIFVAVSQFGVGKEERHRFFFSAKKNVRGKLLQYMPHGTGIPKNKAIGGEAKKKFCTCCFVRYRFAF